MTPTEDEAQNVDAGWERVSHESPAEGGVEGAWDSATSPVSVAVTSSRSPSIAPATDEVDSGWDDPPTSSPPPAGKPRRHRPRRAKTPAVAQSSSPVLQPRPAEPSKKQQREHARRQRAIEAQTKQQRKEERKAERAREMREEAEERLRRAEAERRVQELRREARERAASERPKPVKVVARKPSSSDTQRPLQRAAAETEARASTRSAVVAQSRLPRLVMILAALALVALVIWLLARR